MALFVYEEHGGTPTSSDTDVQMFGETYAQPAGRSIMQFKSWNSVDVASHLSRLKYDWSRITAAIIDEPYLHAPSSPCGDLARIGRILETKQRIIVAGKALKAIAPKTRLWVNFSEPEMEWMMGSPSTCSLPLNDFRIDVVSVDAYEKPFDSIKHYYEYFIASNPQQQLALVPGTHFREGTNADVAASYLQGYFDYAESMNQRCDRGLGRVGRTGNYDGCPVWVVAGWFAGPSFTIPGTLYIGELDPRAAPIASVWKTQLSYPRRTKR